MLNCIQLNHDLITDPWAGVDSIWLLYINHHTAHYGMDILKKEVLVCISLAVNQY